MSMPTRSAVLAAAAARAAFSRRQTCHGPAKKSERPASSSSTAVVTASRNQRSCATRMTAASRDSSSCSSHSRFSTSRWFVGSSCSSIRVPLAKASSPPCTSVSPASIRSSVVLPAPFGPESESRSRRSTENETPWNRSVPAISLCKLEAVTTAMRLSVGCAAMRVLALDVGSSSARVCPYDERGRDAGEAVRRTYSATHGRDGAAELDPNDLVRVCEAVLDETGGGHDALAISCFWHSLLLLDSHDRPLTPVLLWQDRRAAARAEALATRLDPSEVHR